MAMSLPLPRGGKNLICGICREVFRSPRLLPQCHHSFCLHCLDGMVRSRGTTFPCPTCREVAMVPPGGVHHFKINFYISEDELEMERNAEAKSFCTTHPTDELIFFCKECEMSICLRCKLTEHDHGPGCSEDLSKTASRCKDRLAVTKNQLKNKVKKTTKLSAATQEGIKAVKQKADLLKEQINSQHAIIVSTADKHRDQALRDLDQMTLTMTQQLTNDGHKVQRCLDNLIHLEQRVHHAMGSNNHADVVAVDKEMKEDATTAQQLKQMEQTLPKSTQMPSLKNDGDALKDEDVKAFIGSPFKLELPLDAFEGDGDEVTPFFRCPATAEGQEVHAMSKGYVRHTKTLKNNFSLNVAFGGRAPAYKEEMLTIVNCFNQTVTSSDRVGSKVSFEFDGRVQDTKPGEDCIRGSSKKDAEICHNILDGKVTVRYDLNTYIFWREQPKHFDINKAGRPISFDADGSPTVFIVLSEYSTKEEDATLTPKKQSTSAGNQTGLMNASNNSDGNSSKNRSVQMYIKDNKEPACSYVPPHQPFLPTAVCFSKINWQTVLLIADMATDSVHIVEVAQNHFRFIRYLAYGSPLLVCPTALYAEGRYQFTQQVWIGCQNGWVLKCEPGSLVKREEAEKDEEAAEDGSDTATEMLDVGNNSSTTGTSRTSRQQLRVDNGSLTSQATMDDE